MTSLATKTIYPSRLFTAEDLDPKGSLFIEGLNLFDIAIIFQLKPEYRDLILSLLARNGADDCLITTMYSSRHRRQVDEDTSRLKIWEQYLLSYFDAYIKIWAAENAVAIARVVIERKIEAIQSGQMVFAAGENAAHALRDAVAEKQALDIMQEQTLPDLRKQLTSTAPPPSIETLKGIEQGVFADMRKFGFAFDIFTALADKAYRYTKNIFAGGIISPQASSSFSHVTAPNMPAISAKVDQTLAKLGTQMRESLEKAENLPGAEIAALPLSDEEGETEMPHPQIDIDTM